MTVDEILEQRQTRDAMVVAAVANSGVLGIHDEESLGGFLKCFIVDAADDHGVAISQAFLDDVASRALGEMWRGSLRYEW